MRAAQTHVEKSVSEHRSVSGRVVHIGQSSEQQRPSDLDLISVLCLPLCQHLWWMDKILGLAQKGADSSLLWGNKHVSKSTATLIFVLSSQTHHCRWQTIPVACLLFQSHHLFTQLEEAYQSTQEILQHSDKKPKVKKGSNWLGINALLKIPVHGFLRNRKSDEFGLNSTSGSQMIKFYKFSTD